MKTLERYWQWATAEKPTPEVAEKRLSNLSEDASSAMLQAAELIMGRSWPSAEWGRADVVRVALAQYAAPLRDLSLALCEAMPRMRAAVPLGLQTALQVAAKQVHEATAISEQHAAPADRNTINGFTRAEIEEARAKCPPSGPHGKQPWRVYAVPVRPKRPPYSAEHCSAGTGEAHTRFRELRFEWLCGQWLCLETGEREEFAHKSYLGGRRHAKSEFQRECMGKWAAPDQGRQRCMRGIEHGQRDDRHCRECMLTPCRYSAERIEPSGIQVLIHDTNELRFARGTMADLIRDLQHLRPSRVLVNAAGPDAQTLELLRQSGIPAEAMPKPWRGQEYRTLAVDECTDHRADALAYAAGPELHLHADPSGLPETCPANELHQACGSFDRLNQLLGTHCCGVWIHGHPARWRSRDLVRGIATEFERTGKPVWLELSQDGQRWVKA